MSLINKNILANLIGRSWNIVSTFVFIPFYISILGVKMYGIISFYVVLQGLLIFADAGLTATLNRELAKGSNSIYSRKYKYKILKSIEIVYLSIVFLIILTIFIGSDFIVDSWLNIQDLDRESTIYGIKIMGCALGLNFLSKPYQGALIGMERQVMLNMMQIIWGILKNGVVIAVILFVNKTLVTFFAWQLVINFLYVLVLRHYIYSYLVKGDSFVWKFKKDIKLLKTVWKYATGMLIISIIAALNSQFDKIIVSKYFSVTELGIYTIAYSISMIPVVVSGPIATAIFPKFVNLSDNNRYNELIKLFNNSFKIVLLITASSAIVLSIYSDLFLYLWLQDQEIVKKATKPASILIIGQMLLAFQIIPFNYAIAKGNTKINIIIGSVGLIILIPLVLYMVEKYGITGAAFSWLIYGCIITPVLIIYILKKLTKHSVFPWILYNFILPFSLIVFGNLLFYFLKSLFVLPTYLQLLYILFSSSCVFISAFSISFNIKIKNSLKYIKNGLFN